MLKIVVNILPKSLSTCHSLPFSTIFGMKHIDQLNIQIDRYKARKNISCFFMLQGWNLGQDFYDILSLSNLCENNPRFTIIDNEITSKFYKINLSNLFYVFQKNYLNKKDWNGPYIGYPVDDAYGCYFVYYENLDSKCKNHQRMGPTSKWIISTSLKVMMLIFQLKK